MVTKVYTQAILNSQKLFFKKKKEKNLSFEWDEMEM